MNIYVARQPIFDRSLEVIAYELLYRDNDKNFYNASLRDSAATSILLLNSHLNFGLSHLTQGKQGFINFGPMLILDDIPKLLSKESIVIELLESVKPTKELLGKIKELKAEGYIIALDDYESGYPYIEILELADIVKVDFRLNTPNQIRRICGELINMNKILLAEKIETKEEFQWASKIGFEFFQGYFFAKPDIVKQKKLQTAAYSFIRIMNEINEEEPDYAKITSIIEGEVTLAYKLLKLVNSSFALVDNITSIHHGLSILGIDSFRQWFTLATIHQLGTEKPSEISKLSMLRMKFLENIASSSFYKQHINELRLIGLLSVIDIMLDQSMEDALKQLPVSDTIKDTLLSKPSIYRQIYDLCLSYEKGDFNTSATLSDNINLDFNLFPTLYLDAVEWSNELFDYLSETSEELV